MIRERTSSAGVIPMPLLAKVAAMPDVRQKFASLDFDPVGGSSEELAAAIVKTSSGIESWQKTPTSRSDSSVNVVRQLQDGTIRTHGHR